MLRMHSVSPLASVISTHTTTTLIAIMVPKCRSMAFSPELVEGLSPVGHRYVASAIHQRVPQHHQRAQRYRIHQYEEAVLS